MLLACENIDRLQCMELQGRALPRGVKAGLYDLARAVHDEPLVLAGLSVADVDVAEADAAAAELRAAGGLAPEPAAWAAGGGNRTGTRRDVAGYAPDAPACRSLPRRGGSSARSPGPSHSRTAAQPSRSMLMTRRRP